MRVIVYMEVVLTSLEMNFCNAQLSIRLRVVQQIRYLYQVPRSEQETGLVLIVLIS